MLWDFMFVYCCGDFASLSMLDMDFTREVRYFTLVLGERGCYIQSAHFQIGSEQRPN